MTISDWALTGGVGLYTPRSVLCVQAGGGSEAGDGQHPALQRDRHHELLVRLLRLQEQRGEVGGCDSGPRHPIDTPGVAWKCNSAVLGPIPIKNLVSAV